MEGQHNRFTVGEVGRMAIEGIDADIRPDSAGESRSSPTRVSQADGAITLARGIVNIDYGTLSCG
ncbi:hypothetical protein SDC9_199297 [bioreactor metagenome]|uniref:Uncharacterized protein n=1 Tax=bioreactor metagenome TaxID=1076179 RepID=A0A645IK24_9ZZZZ